MKAVVDPEMFDDMQLHYTYSIKPGHHVINVQNTLGAVKEYLMTAQPPNAKQLLIKAVIMNRLLDQTAGTSTSTKKKKTKQQQAAPSQSANTSRMDTE